MTIDNGGAVCRSLDCTTYTGTLTHNTASTLTIGDATAGAGSKALTLVAGMTYTKNNNTTSRLTFASTSGTQQTITWAAKTAGSTTFQGVGSSYLFADGFTGASATATILTLTNGILDTNGKAVTTGIVSITGALARTLTCGATTFTMASTTTPWDATTTTNLTFNANTSTIALTGNGPVMQGGGLTYNTVNWTGAGTKELAGANTFANLSIVGTNTLTNIMQFDASQTITTLLTLTGNTAVNRMLVTSQTVGTAITLTAASVSLADIDFQDITGAGAATWSGTRVGNAQGNSGITFATPKSAYWVGITSNWSVTNRWAASSGGATGVNNYPLPQDTAVFDAASFAVDGNTISFNSQGVQRHASIDTTLADQTFTLAAGAALLRTCGSMTLSNKVTISSIPNFIGRGSNTLTASGATLTDITINAPGGTVTPQDALVLSGNITLQVGTFSGNNQAITASAAFDQGSGTKTLNMGGGQWIITGTAGFGFTGSGTTFNTNSSNISFTGVSANTTFNCAAGKTFGNFNFSGSSAGVLIFAATGQTDFGSFVVDSSTNAKAIRLQDSRTIVVTSFGNAGTSGSVVTLDSTTPGTAATISKASGTVSIDYWSIKDSTATGGATFYAGANSTNVSGNTGWIFSAPSSGGTLPMMGV